MAKLDYNKRHSREEEEWEEGREESFTTREYSDRRNTRTHEKQMEKVRYRKKANTHAGNIIINKH